MPVKMLPTSVIKARLGIEKNGRVQAFLTETCYKHMDKYVPYDTGNLAYDSVDVQTDKIIYQAPYAKTQYTGIRDGKPIVNRKSAGHEYAGSYWDKRMISAEMSDVTKEVQDFLRSGR